MVRRLLEQQFDNPVAGQHTILQVSSGFTYRYSLAAPPGRRVDPASVKVRDRLLRPADRIRVAANNFLAAGGDNFSVFLEGTNRIGGAVDIDATMAYFRTKSPIRPGTQDRIVRTD